MLTAVFSYAPALFEKNTREGGIPAVKNSRQPTSAGVNSPNPS